MFWILNDDLSNVYVYMVLMIKSRHMRIFKNTEIVKLGYKFD